MSIAGYNTQITTVTFPDQAGDDIMPGFRAPAVGATILRAVAIADTTFDADGSNHYTVSLIDGGATGIGTDVMGSAGGASVDWTADTEKELVLTQDAVDGDDWVHVQYDETGTVAPGNITVCIEWTAGGT